MLELLIFVTLLLPQLAVECIFCSACIRFAEYCPQEGITEKLWIGLESFIFDWLINADRVVSQVDYPSLVDLRSLLLDLVAQLLGALSRIRFSSVTEKFFMELNTRRIDTPVARSETLSIINGMRYLKLGVKTEGALNASVSFIAKANPLNRPPNKRKSEMQHALCNMLSSILAPLAECGKNHWPPLGVEPALSLWLDFLWSHFYFVLVMPTHSTLFFPSIWISYISISRTRTIDQWH